MSFPERRRPVACEKATGLEAAYWRNGQNALPARSGRSVRRPTTHRIRLVTGSGHEDLAREITTRSTSDRFRRTPLIHRTNHTAFLKQRGSGTLSHRTSRDLATDHEILRRREIIDHIEPIAVRIHSA